MLQICNGLGHFFLLKMIDSMGWDRWPRSHFPPSWLRRRIFCPQDTSWLAAHVLKILSWRHYMHAGFIFWFPRMASGQQHLPWGRLCSFAVWTLVELFLTDQRQKAFFTAARSVYTIQVCKSITGCCQTSSANSAWTTRRAVQRFLCA